MEQLKDTLDKIKIVGQSLDHEIPLLFKQLESTPSDDNVTGHHFGYYAVKNAEEEVDKYLGKMKKLKNEVKEFENFNDFISSTKLLIDDMEEQLQSNIKYLSKYGYTPKVKNKISNENEEIKNSKLNETPEKKPEKCDLDKTPDLSDYGLSHLKDFKGSQKRFDGIQKNPQLSKNQSQDVECTPALLRHNGLQVSPTLFVHPEKSFETPIPEKEFSSYSSLVSDRSDMEGYKSSQIHAESFFPDTEKKFTTMGIQKSLNFEYKNPSSFRMKNRAKFSPGRDDGENSFDESFVISSKNLSKIPDSSNARFVQYGMQTPSQYPEERFQNESDCTLLMTSNLNHNQIHNSYKSNKIETDGDTPEEPKFKYRFFDSKQITKDTNVNDEETPDEPKFSKIKSKSDGSNSTISTDFKRNTIVNENTPEEPEFKVKPLKYNIINMEEDELPQTPELTSVYKGRIKSFHSKQY